jgi:hypothetical protein
MVRKQQMIRTPTSSAKRPITGYEKMQMSYDHMRKDIKRVRAEREKTEATGMPKHQIR